MGASYGCRLEPLVENSYAARIAFGVIRATNEWQLFESTLDQARKQGYVNTLYGRKRFFPDMHGLPFSERQALEREAINMPIQGGNADLIKIAMIRIQHAIEQKHLKTRMILQVHDELVFEVPVEELEKVRHLVKHEMEGVAKLDVPIKVEMKVGKNWYEAETME